MLQEVHLVEIQRVAVADDLAESQPPLLPSHHHSEGMAAALRQEADAAGLFREDGVEGDLLFGVVEPHAVGADDADARFLDPLAQLALKLRCILAAGLTEAGGEEVDELGPLGLGAFNQLQHEARRNGGDHKIDGSWNFLEARVCLQPQ